jgi:hypothetical protein
MRHADIKLTMGVYTDPKLLDIRDALDALPALDLAGDRADAAMAQATGTDAASARKFAPGFAPTRCNPVQTETTGVKVAAAQNRTADANRVDASATAGETKQPLTIPVSGSL